MVIKNNHFPRESGVRDSLVSECRDESLRTISEAIIVISAEIKDLLNPKSNRHSGIAVVSAEHEDEGVKKESAV